MGPHATGLTKKVISNIELEEAMSKLKVVVNADDFGKSPDVNKKIEYCHKHGVLSSASLVANGEYFNEAVEMAMNNQRLGIGVHLAIDEFEPFYRGPSSIIDPVTNKFYPGNIVLKNVSRFSYHINDLVNEYSYQIEKVLDCGLRVTHIDHHHEFNLYWPVLNAMIKVAEKYGIRQIRSQWLLFQENRKFIKTIYRFFHQRYLMHKNLTIDGHLKFENSDFFQNYEKMVKISKSTNKTIQIVTHPSTENEYEVSFLTDPRILSVFENVKLINFGDLSGINNEQI